MTADDNNTRVPARPADGDLWRRVAGSVRPLPRDRGRPAPALTEPPGSAATATDPPSRQEPRRSPDPRGPTIIPPVPPQDLSHGSAAGLDKRSLARLRRGMLPIEGTIDLHGMTQAEAHSALHAFIVGSHQRGRRCVLVITGKGSRSEGVLRNAVPHWLNLPATRSLVLAFTYATPVHGGAGALYVLLKRQRS